MLRVEDLNVYYGLIHAVKNISFNVKKAQITTLIGSNGAGKTSTLGALVNDVKQKGKVYYKDKLISKMPTHKIIKQKISLVPEGRRVFGNLTIEENLRLGAYNNAKKFDELRDKYFEMFPRIKQKRHHLARSLSGGEQQMLALSRALMGEPDFLMLDEPSLGLAPKIIGELFDSIIDLKNNGMTILLIEQNANAALAISDYAYVLENGEITLEGDAKILLDNDEVRAKYLGA